MEGLSHFSTYIYNTYIYIYILWKIKVMFETTNQETSQLPGGAVHLKSPETWRWQPGSRVGLKQINHGKHNVLEHSMYTGIFIYVYTLRKGSTA